MDPVQAGFCHEPPKPYPSSNPSPSTIPRLTPTTHFKPRIRFSALFPALHLLKDALPRRGRASLFQPLQPKTQIKVLVKNHSQVSTENIMHPYKDPFSRARIPYLECSPPRKVKASIIDLAKKWDDTTMKSPENGGLDIFSLEEMKSEFDWHFDMASKESMYPYNAVIIPKIQAAANFIFQLDNLYVDNVTFASKLLELIRRGRTSFDAVFLTSQLLCLPHFKFYADKRRWNMKYKHDIHRQLKTLGRRIAHICAIYGHPEATFLNVQLFHRLYRHNAKNPNYHFYKTELLDILKSFAGTYPDSRAYSHMIQLETRPGGNLENARQYCILGLERPTRPRGYEVALIHAGQLLLDHTEAMKAFQLAMQLLSQPISSSDHIVSFPFATRQRLLYKYQSLDILAEALCERAKSTINVDDARMLNQFRLETLILRRALRPQLIASRAGRGEEEWKYFAPKSLDEMMFQLLDPEAVLEEEEMMKIRPAVGSEPQGVVRRSIAEMVDAIAGVQSARSTKRTIQDASAF